MIGPFRNPWFWLLLAVVLLVVVGFGLTGWREIDRAGRARESWGDDPDDV